MERKRKKAFKITLIQNDFKQIASSKKMIVGLIGVLMLPVIYSCIYLSAFFNPYDNLKYLPVAIVNEDLGAELQGEKIEIGKDLINKLRSDSKVKWEFVDRSQMNKGFKNGSFYMGVVIPSDFSDRAKSVSSAKPLQGKLAYYSEESTNYLTTRLGQSIIAELKNNLAEKLTKVYVEKIFSKMSDSVHNLARAADGAEELAVGTDKVKQGAERVDHKLKEVRTIADIESARIKDKLETVKQEGVKGQQKLHKIAQQLRSYGPQIHKVNQDIQTYAAQPAYLDITVENINQYLSKTHIALDLSKQAIQDSLEVLEKVTEDPALSSNPSLIKNKNILKAKLKNLQSIQHKLAKLDENKLKKDLGQDRTLKQILAHKSQEYTTLYDSKMNQLSETEDKVEQRLSLLDTETEGMDQKKEVMLTGLDRLIHEGTSKIVFGLGKISDGQSQLANGLSDGVKIASDHLQGVNEKGKVIANPVKVDENPIHSVPNYATGLAPYFISLSLWVGAMILFTVSEIYRVPNHPDGEPLSFTVASLVGIFQAIIISFALTAGIGIEPVLTGMIYLFCMIISITFMSLNRMLGVLFSDAGRLLSIALLMFQLAASAGTYPIELLPEFFQSINPYMPMTYTVHGLRAILSSGNMEAVLQDMNILLGFTIASYVISQVFIFGVKPALKRRLQS